MDPSNQTSLIDGEAGEYLVLARKYRPRDFSTLIGQDALVRTLRNAFETGRLAHAFLLSGVRGVGKTTTARIVARALNCQEDGRTSPAADPCGTCPSCLAISEDRSVDVIEMDAASHTGVDNMREIMDGMKYVPVSSRYKIYIIDEVHMLSKAAFNALLKTLEEPPAHVKFIFATTEADRVPITVRSRCQRFDLRRISAEQLATYFRGLTDKEGVTISDDALHLIAQAADGSARDGLSLLDQAIALGGGAIEVEAVRDMLGLSNYGRLVELFEAIAHGQTEQVLSLFEALYNDGADPAAVVRSVAEFAHELTRLHVTRGEARLTSGEGHREAMLTLARSLSMAQLSRFWQAALAGLREVQSAFQPSMAAEMVLLRLCYLSQMPDPGQLVEQMRAGGAAVETPPTSPEPPPPAPASAPDNGPRVALAPSGAPVSASPPSPAPTPPASPTPQPETATEAPPAAAVETGPPDWADIPPPDAADAPDGPEPVAATAPPFAGDALTEDGDIAPTPYPEPQTLPGGFEGLVSLIGEQASALLGAQLAEDVHLVRFEPPRLDLRLTSRAPRDLPRQVQEAVLRLTGERLTVAISDEEGQLPLAEARRVARQAELDEATRHPTVQAALQAFPSAKVQDVRYKPNAIPQEE
ncbi:MAG: DNA polymerase III subunit gamma/tau [Alphaproteobacteria bacterium]